MENLLQGIPGVTVYVDDILITGATEEEHLKSLEEVLRRLAKAGLLVSKHKCRFMVPMVAHLGHSIDTKGLHPLLVHFDSQLPLTLACDASPYGVGAVLAHRMPDGAEKPIGYTCRTLNKAERNYSQLDLLVCLV
jgi:hypothetical protein